MNMDYLKRFSGDQVMSFEEREPMFLWGCRLGSKWVRSIMKTSVYLTFPLTSFLLFPVQLNLRHF